MATKQKVHSMQRNIEPTSEVPNIQMGKNFINIAFVNLNFVNWLTCYSLEITVISQP